MADSHDTTPDFYGKSPAFQFYPKDFITDENVSVMSMQERGLYITLICKCWIEGTLPKDSAKLAKLCGVPLVQFRRWWPACAVCFRDDPERADRLTHPRLERELAKQAIFRRRQSDKGRASAEKRRVVQPEVNRGSTVVQPITVQPRFNSSISDLRSASSHSSERAFAHAKDSEVERAGAFVQRYKDLHRKYRNGATYVNKHESFDFEEALILVKAYPDERLDLLARVWFQADDTFAEQGTRTMAKFRSRVSWCEEQLIAFEQKQAVRR